ncbi:MAG TPA: hypothetical protein VH437_08720 [Terriglobales bacterium]
MRKIARVLPISMALLNFACSRPANPNAGEASSAPPPEVKVASTAPYPSGTTQSVMLNISRADESKGITASSSGGCGIAGSPEKTGLGAYKLTLEIPAHSEDGTCTLRIASGANGGAANVSIAYVADPEYWKHMAPTMYEFAHSKTWVFHSGDEMKTFHLLETAPSSGSKIAVLLVGDKDARAGMSLSPDNSIVGEFNGCVVEGKIAGKTAILKPMMPGDACTGITTVTLNVSN